MILVVRFAIRSGLMLSHLPPLDQAFSGPCPQPCTHSRTHSDARATPASAVPSDHQLATVLIPHHGTMPPFVLCDETRGRAISLRHPLQSWYLRMPLSWSSATMLAWTLRGKAMRSHCGTNSSGGGTPIFGSSSMTRTSTQFPSISTAMDAASQ